MELAGMHKLAQLQNWMKLQNSTFNAPIPFHALVIDTGANHFPFTPLAKEYFRIVPNPPINSNDLMKSTWYTPSTSESRNTVFTGGTDTTVILQLFGMDCNV